MLRATIILLLGALSTPVWAEDWCVISAELSDATRDNKSQTAQIARTYLLCNQTLGLFGVDAAGFESLGLELYVAFIGDRQDYDTLATQICSRRRPTDGEFNVDVVDPGEWLKLKDSNQLSQMKTSAFIMCKGDSVEDVSVNDP